MPKVQKVQKIQKIQMWFAVATLAPWVRNACACLADATAGKLLTQREE